MVALMRVSNSSSPRMANWRCLGVIRFTFKSLHAFPASSRTSAVRYSKIAEVYTAAEAPTRWLVCTEVLRKRCTRPTGNYGWHERKGSNERWWIPRKCDIKCQILKLTWSPALDERDCGAFLEVGPFPPFPPLPPLPPLPFPDCSEDWETMIHHGVRLKSMDRWTRVKKTTSDTSCAEHVYKCYAWVLKVPIVSHDMHHRNSFTTLLLRSNLSSKETSIR